MMSVLIQALGKPQCDLGLGAVNGITAVANIATDIDTQVTTNSARIGVGRVGGSQHEAASFHSSLSLPDHGEHWTHEHVLDQRREELLRRKVGVVLLKMGFGWRAQFHCHQLEPLRLEAGSDVADQTALNAVWLDHDVSHFLIGPSLISNIARRSSCRSTCLCCLFLLRVRQLICAAYKIRELVQIELCISIRVHGGKEIVPQKVRTKNTSSLRRVFLEILSYF